MDQQEIGISEMTTKSASGLVEIGIQRLLGRYPLFGGLVATWNLVEDATITTMAVGFGNFDFNLYFNSDFVRGISMDQLVGVLHHEARHIVYGHLWMDPKDYPDDNALVIAQEVTVNEGIPEPLPARPMLLKDFPNLKPNEDTETRYRRLAKGMTSQETKRAGQGGAPQQKAENEKIDKDSHTADAAKARSTGPATAPTPSDSQDGNTIVAPDNAGTTKDGDHGAANAPSAKPSNPENAPASSGGDGTEKPERQTAAGAVSLHFSPIK